MAIDFLLKNFNDVLFLHPAATVYVVSGKFYLNKKAQEITGFKDEDFSSIDDWFRAAFNDDIDKTKELYYKAKKAGFPKVDRVLFKRADGQKRVIDFQGKTIGDVEVWHLNDVTEVIETEQRFSVLFNHSSDPHLLLGEDGVIDCNEAMVRMMNADGKDQLLTLHPATFSPEYQPDGQLSRVKSIDMDAQALKKGFHKFDWVHRRVTGEEFSVEVNISSVNLGSKQVFLIVIHDLTEKNETQARILTSAKMATLGEMASNIAHEINNPLAVIQAYAHRIKKQFVVDKVLKEDVLNSVDKINQTVSRISKIIKGLRSFARDSDDLGFETLDLKSIFAETLDICAERMKNGGITIDVNIDENIFVRGQSVQLSQVFMNLIGNSADAIGVLPEKWIKVSSETNENLVTLRFSDSGTGIPGLIVQNMMRPFFTTKEVGKGTGLGLSISKGIVESHGGTFKYETFKGHTSFVITLPVCQIVHQAA